MRDWETSENRNVIITKNEYDLDDDKTTSRCLFENEMRMIVFEKNESKRCTITFSCCAIEKKNWSRHEQNATERAWEDMNTNRASMMINNDQKKMISSTNSIDVAATCLLWQILTCINAYWWWNTNRIDNSRDECWQSFVREVNFDHDRIRVDDHVFDDESNKESNVESRQRETFQKSRRSSTKTWEIEFCERLSSSSRKMTIFSRTREAFDDERIESDFLIDYIKSIEFSIKSIREIVTKYRVLVVLLWMWMFLSII